jgi:hypothetical protein
LLLASLLVAGGTLAGCGSDAPKTPRIQDVLPNMPLPPNAAIVSREGGEEALQFTFQSSDSASTVAQYYRLSLPNTGWNLISDQRSREGEISIYAERNGPPIWIAIRPDSTTGGSIVRIAGAVTEVPRDTIQAPRGVPADTVDVR